MSTKWRITAGAIALGAAGAVAGCATEASFEVGDCVRIAIGVIDADLESADCDGAVGTFNAEERIYRVDEVIDGTSGGCPSLSGFFPVEFVHEPDDVTYCLVQES